MRPNNKPNSIFSHCTTQIMHIKQIIIHTKFDEIVIRVASEISRRFQKQGFRVLEILKLENP